jgi:hypothetical protein
MTDLPNFVRDRLRAEAAGTDHPDADMLTAFSEKLLREPERAWLLEHLAHCSQCREVLALAMPPVEAQGTVAPAAGSWLGWPVLRWASLAACLVVVSGAVLFYQDRSHQEQSHTAPYVAMRSDSDVTQPASVPPIAGPEEGESKRQEGLHSRANLQVEEQAPAKVATGPAIAAGEPAERKSLDRATALRDAGVGKAQQYGTLTKATPAVNTRADVRADNFPGGRLGAKDELAASNELGAKTVPAASPSSPAERLAGGVSSGTEDMASGAIEAQPESGNVSASPGKAKAAPAAAAMQQAVPAASPVNGFAKKELSVDTKPVASAAGARWTLSGKGQLQRSIDGGKTWEPIPVVENVTFRALSASGSEIWVGGLGGVLYRSSDAGTHWTQVRPAEGDVKLTGDIISVRFADPQHGQLTTSTGETWTTTDQGRTWHKSGQGTFE